MGKFLKSSKRIFELLLKSPLICILILLMPSIIAVYFANTFADLVHAYFRPLIDVFTDSISSIPGPINSMLVGDYGIVSMLPFLILYALPTILIFTALISFYKSTGITKSLSLGLQKVLNSYGLSSEDLVRIIMGYGCNVPAIASTRSCNCNTRESCVSAISHGSICSYQLSSSLAIFSAAGFFYLAPIYVFIVGFSTLIYLKIIKRNNFTLLLNKKEIHNEEILKYPNWITISNEIKDTLKEFIKLALPIFILICFVSTILNLVGFLNLVAYILSPIMTLFNLPADSALSVVLGSIRKDGIAVGLLNSDWNSLKVNITNPAQILTIVYLASVLLPCIVTLFTIVKEMKIKFALKMLLKQATLAIVCSLIIAWTGVLVF